MQNFVKKSGFFQRCKKKGIADSFIEFRDYSDIELGSDTLTVFL